MLTSTSALAQDIELKAKDGSMTLKGQLLSFEDRNFTIRTSLGALVVSADDMDCVGEACPVMKPPAAEFRVTGAKTAGADLLPQLFDAYASSTDVTLQIGAHPEEGQLLIVNDSEDDPLANIQLVSTNSSAGLVDLLQGDAQMAVSTRPPRPTEADAFVKSGLGAIQSRDQEHVLALQSVVIIASPDNPIEAISDETAAKIFSGTIENWSEIGGPDAPIQIYVSDRESQSGEAFNSIVMAPQSQQVRPDAIIVDSDARLAQRVAADAFGIGFTSFGNAQDAKPLAITGSCNLRVAPSVFAVKSEEYPLTRRLTAYTTEGGTPDQLEGFFEFLTSDAAQETVADAGFVTQEITSTPLITQTNRLGSVILGTPGADAIARLQTMVVDMTDASQLSTAFRFIPGTNQLDARAFADLDRLAKHLQNGDFEGKIVKIASFADAAADPAQNLPLSAQRAAMIQTELLAIDPTLEQTVTFQATGYGDISPLTCGGTATGQHINSRVEIWVKDAINDSAN